MLGKLGRPYKVVYAAKNFVTGLTNIVARVEKPNGTYIGLFPLIESGDAFFTGIYSFDLNLSALNPEGEYTIVIIEPTSGHKDVRKVTMELDGAGGGGGGSGANSVLLFGKINNNILTGKIKMPSVLTGKILEC